MQIQTALRIGLPIVYGVGTIASLPFATGSIFLCDADDNPPGSLISTNTILTSLTLPVSFLFGAARSVVVPTAWPIVHVVWYCGSMSIHFRQREINARCAGWKNAATRIVTGIKNSIRNVSVALTPDFLESPQKQTVCYFEQLEIQEADEKDDENDSDNNVVLINPTFEEKTAHLPSSLPDSTHQPGPTSVRSNQYSALVEIHLSAEKQERKAKREFPITESNFEEEEDAEQEGRHLLLFGSISIRDEQHFD